MKLGANEMGGAWHGPMEKCKCTCNAACGFFLDGASETIKRQFCHLWWGCCSSHWWLQLGTELMQMVNCRICFWSWNPSPHSHHNPIILLSLLEGDNSKHIFKNQNMHILPHVGQEKESWLSKEYHFFSGKNVGILRRDILAISHDKFPMQLVWIPA